MNTINKIETEDTSELRRILKIFEEAAEINEVIMDDAKKNNYSYGDLYKENLDNEIDIVLIRRELNRRLWEEK